MIYGYIRVSTENQNLENQKNAIAEKFKIDEWIEEKKSGTIDYHKRNLGGLMEKLRQGDALVITELSRLGRSISMVFEIITELKKRKVIIIIPVHDEILIETPLRYASFVKKQFSMDMETAARPRLTIPISCDVVSSERWTGEELDINEELKGLEEV